MLLVELGAKAIIVRSLSLMLATDKKYNHSDAKRKKRDQASSEKHDLFLVLLTA
jgi:hypothetical protein